MKFYALSLTTGILVGVIYSLLQVRSPAPPLIALLGLLGMLAGEQIIPTGKQLLNTWRFSEQKAHMVIQGFLWALSTACCKFARLRHR